MTKQITKNYQTHEKLIKCIRFVTVDGDWATWSTWSTCSVSCTPASGSVTGGTWTRTRNCSDPEPKYDGLQCTGDSVETDSCTIATTCPGTVSSVLFNPIKPNVLY